MERESMEFDVVIVGAGPSGLAAACRLMQISKDSGQELTVCVVEKGSEVGAHILSGAVFEPKVLDELFDDWREKGAPLNTAVTHDEIHMLSSATDARAMPNALVPKTMHNHGNYIISVGNLCRWLAERAEELGVEVFPGFPASELLFNPDGSVKGIQIGDMGVGEDGQPKDAYEPGMELHAKYTVFGEGCRGHLGKQLIEKFHLDNGKTAQHYGLGFKEIWTVPSEQHELGKVVHTGGWPLNDGASGGGFMYHLEDNQIAVGLIVDLNYKNPHLSPFDEFQRFKTHPVIAKTLSGGERIAYGARAITKGGLNSLPKMTFPGGMIIGCDAGTLNFAKIKGTHTAMKSGILAAETLGQAMLAGVESGKDLDCLQDRFDQSWLKEELYASRNFGPAMHKFGTYLGGAFNFIDQNWFGGKLPITLRDDQPDYAQMGEASAYNKIDYPKPDGKLSFDKLSSVYLSNTYHEEDQLCHLRLKDARIPIDVNLVKFDEPAQRYCPAGVYEVVEEAGEKKFVINGQNCIHCKTCDIKDPSQNITWVTPEGGGGPNYPNM
ncbi:electron transfer flavoprotein-ubiquinone oxidoreductase [Shewanella fidelis]|uniref:Electron transfer flavoprotein-ubiquinone oxidoreductase n=1 Tax=Shewanella fidelis TaxID=173509 RepID=A0AAW8NSF8_9GAMM|nr:electron transfer flavoprotein-ubiquinone oxidoreductase [Shewanella fidelis]MDR8525732.1 electron transfer flavoprotein-ubiquinone oxidoreductase [Shewanella fidelis]MDW4812759.1 electron transfer flavoprotein-ubiquinone oxidoreductase [Shewanella fidelis]MDW4816507.1 electron transfer flavoprotein-ubiquinone oxidoreductase [Shewanella fidelis]MDW4820329.1 electron transfer flavoprotein-ubiquinone oxidoreductase [Shewanella fidelis]MDW4825223.1 electron transfer flavoprotein-ubiquinone oxi